LSFVHVSGQVIVHHADLAIGEPFPE
jgi:hypothetical protein